MAAHQTGSFLQACMGVMWMLLAVGHFWFAYAKASVMLRKSRITTLGLRPAHWVTVMQ
jgi:hypothetical protein